MKTKSVKLVPIALLPYFKEPCYRLPLELIDQEAGNVHKFAKQNGYASIRSMIDSVDGWQDELASILDIVAPDALKATNALRHSATR